MKNANSYGVTHYIISKASDANSGNLELDRCY